MRRTILTGLRFFRWICCAALSSLLVTAIHATPVPRGTPSTDPPIGHVFVIVLENESYSTTFGPDSKAPYLAVTLPKQGVVLDQYFGTAHFSLPNYLAMISGQAATPETRDDCEVYRDFEGAGLDAEGQAQGHGCVYPPSVRTIAQQLTEHHKTWRAYMEDMGNDPAREPATCGHGPLNGADPTQHAEAPSVTVPKGDQYAARHNPFVYFHSVIDSPDCDRFVVNLAALRNDLGRLETTPNLSFISPNLCHDGHDSPCKNGEPGGLVSADAFLREWVPRIQRSPAYRKDGLLIIVFDEGDAEEKLQPTGGTLQEYPGERCCNQRKGPNLGDFPQVEHWDQDVVTFADFGGDRTGAVLLSPRLVPGTIARTPFNHYALLKSLEHIFGINEYLGYAGASGLVDFFDCRASDVPLRRPFHGCVAKTH